MVCLNDCVIWVFEKIITVTNVAPLYGKDEPRMSGLFHLARDVFTRKCIFRQLEIFLSSSQASISGDPASWQRSSQSISTGFSAPTGEVGLKSFDVTEVDMRVSVRFRQSDVVASLR